MDHRLDLEERTLTERRAFREIKRVWTIRFTDNNGDERQVVTRSGPFRVRILAAFGGRHFHPTRCSHVT
jgi:hypothetical protein